MRPSLLTSSVLRTADHGDVVASQMCVPFCSSFAPSPSPIPIRDATLTPASLFLCVVLPCARLAIDSHGAEAGSCAVPDLSLTDLHPCTSPPQLLPNLSRLLARVGDARRLVRCHFVNPHGKCKQN